ncbi:unnamed protein product [Hermetia illucens]|uniref:Secreted protein n=1 Tax=Hermetia illucens TaxID=343691 RepID=A0A7R8YMJ4_HERIL|nr:unnamed protein product [Hermetia illucens]
MKGHRAPGRVLLLLLLTNDLIELTPQLFRLVSICLERRTSCRHSDLSRRSGGQQYSHISLNGDDVCGMTHSLYIFATV